MKKNEYVEVKMNKTLLLYKDYELYPLLITDKKLYEIAIRRGKTERRTRNKEWREEKEFNRAEDKFFKELGFFPVGE
ncbi:MAG: hypothetical protein QXI12_06695 [Candidatus Methanomethyliaceae archaeon]